MSAEGSYQISTVASSVQHEIQRLQGQVALFWEKEVKHYVEFGLRDGHSVVELGAGPGYVTENILRQFPHTRVVAVEIDPLLADYAREHTLSSFGDRCEILDGSIMATGLPDDTFDFAVTRLVLEHLHDPVSAVREVKRILKPGGTAVFVDNDFEMHIMTYPSIPELRLLYEAYCESRIAEGGSPRLGRQLPSVLRQGGFAEIDFEVICAHSDLLGDEMFLKSEGIGIPTKLVKDGFLPSKTLAQIAYAWRNMIRHEQHSILRQLYLAAGRK
ncbi:methyltransferase domain-containing protein [Paenibacillus sp. A3M_27_13]|uniref:methyltransferase domain-containing protein n=1 Tax=Paenibacillus sp. A3M_27_13 TaxID=2962029 RepID=UPI0020B6D459|nr:methyltransferase domain-containing protein [Paenibacillus sp. A3M_27_13]MCP3748134.1 methyltransferase domain-containing protein [Paenibacillus sp. A3M_27_13]